MKRVCGSCTLCCRLLPQRELDKGSNERCRHQRHTGCAIYERRPPSCRLWSCLWLTGPDTDDLSRPDRSHYVIDPMLDYVTVVTEEGRVDFPALQVWIDPHHPDAHRDPQLRAYIDRRGEEGILALIRSSNEDGFVLVPPSMTGKGWFEHHGGVRGPEHTAEQKFAALGGRMGL